MKNRCEVKVRPELLENTHITDEYLFREIARKMVTDMPIKELHKLIKLRKINPFSNESVEAFYNDNLSDLKIQKINQLRMEGLLLFTAKVDLP